MNVLSLCNGMSFCKMALDTLHISVDKFYSSEIDKYANIATQAMFPDTIQLGDILNWREWDLDWGSIDLITAGTPCQGFSTSGKQLNFNDNRSKLFFVFVDILNHTKTLNLNVKFFFENVRMKSANLDIISGAIGVKGLFINSALVSAQNRPRYYWANWAFDLPRDKNISAIDVLNIGNEKIGQMQPFPRNYKKLGLKRVERFEARSDGKSNACLTRSNKNLVNTSTGRRELTPYENCILQTVPEHHISTLLSLGISKTQLTRMIGNGWTHDVITHIFRGLPANL